MTPQRSRLLVGRLFHNRVAPKRHQFEYGHYWLAVDLDELPILSKTLLGFGYNRWHILSIRDRDYLDDSDRPIFEKVKEVLGTAPYRDAITAVTLVTSPRYFGKVFNPINFYYCYAQNREIVCILAEVNNTFSESHLYILDSPSKSNHRLVQYQHAKEFYVSPFNDLKGTYEFALSDVIDTVDIRLNLIRDQQPLINTRFWGTAVPLTSIALWKTLARYPFLGLAALAKIGFNAIILKLKGVPSIMKPRPSHINTFRRSGVAKTVGKRQSPTTLDHHIIAENTHVTH